MALSLVSIFTAAAGAAIPRIDDPVSRGIEIALTVAHQWFDPKKQHFGIMVSKQPSVTGRYHRAIAYARANV
ncbi:hypothetical protein F6X37_04730 [Paraburkholderia sp. 31.1]|uniref:hypothetical protein n=1 Tax=Paraburkholderia sp. 31.1 TaxID=2615205 RepID=UPI0016564288|nr:hypothetical protein [Paraburkholderia sp. 31.1]MBC8720926.1 hypothetical protein [Paraburkholderia sp. 31.1]